jgi:actin-related protein
MGYAGNNDPQFIIPSAIATKEAPTASSRVGASAAASSGQKKGNNLNI